MNHSYQRSDRNLYNKQRAESCYGVWANIIQRCTNKNHPLYRRYGAKGITICEKWRSSFNRFALDMGKRPTPLHSIDRIDNSKGYYKENCRWATKTVQSINRNRQVNNKSGIPGVSWDKSRSKWTAHIQVNRKDINLGRFDTIEEAVKIREEAVELYHRPLLS